MRHLFQVNIQCIAFSFWSRKDRRAGFGAGRMPATIRFSSPMSASTPRAPSCGPTQANLIAHDLDASDPALLARHVADHPCDAVISSLPFYCNPGVAKVARAAGLHYFDLTEDVEVTLRALYGRGASTAFVPQCGLAPASYRLLPMSWSAIRRAPQHSDARRAPAPAPNNVLKYRSPGRPRA